MSDSIKVAIKVRPLIKREKDDNLPIQWVVYGNSIVSTDTELKKRGDGGFCFDHIFDTNASNSDVFDSIVKPIVDAAVNGFNGTVFAYGQTSSGKTYTMMGTLNEPGIIPLAIEHMFDAITNTAGREFLLRVSYLEIYKEKVNDLLNRTGTDLKLKEDSSGQVILQCKEEITNCPENMLSIMKKGDKYRRTGETNMNERSSRSHTIFRITIESREAGGDSDSAIQVSQLNLVDLAGSERARQTGATGERFKEGLHINLSLSTLGLVIMQLSECQDGQKYVNFRDSKLTRLLQNSLGGNAMTAIICAVTPAAVDETQCTLSFACRAKSVKNKPHINEVMSDAALLKRYAKQISKLQTELEKIKTENRVAEVEEMESKLQEKERVNQMLEERIGLLKTRIVSGDIAGDDSFKCKSKRRQTWGGPGMFKHMEAFQPTPGLPTIKEMSRKRSGRKSIIQSDDIDLMNQTFQTAFTDFELELFKSECDREDEENGSDSDDEPFITKRVTFRDDVYTIKSKDSIILEKNGISAEKCNSATQTVNCQISPSTPKQFLRRQINYLTNEFKELREFTTLEKQLIFNADDSKEYAPEVKKLLENLNLTEETNVNRVIAELCKKFSNLEQEKIQEKEASRRAMKSFSELEIEIKNITSERDEFQYMSGELCRELKKRTAELELKNMSEANVKEEELKKILELERKLKDVTLQNTELRAESTKKITELRREVENVDAERKEFELIRRELCMQLNKKSLELEKMKNDPERSNQEIATNLRELEKKTEEISFEKAALEQIVIDLKAQLDRVSSDAESRLVLERTAHAETLGKVSQLQKQVTDLAFTKDEIQRVNNDLKAQLTQSLADLESKVTMEQAAKQEVVKYSSELDEKKTNDKLFELERKVESITLEKNHLKEKMQLEEAEYQKMMEKVNDLTNQIADVANQNTELKQNISNLENKTAEQMEAISELESRIRGLASEKKELNCIIAEKREETLKLESSAIERIREIETINLQKKELEQVNTELKQSISNLETKAEKQIEAISELESKIRELAIENEKLNCIIAEKNDESLKQESTTIERIREIETINLQKKELEQVNTELKLNISNLETKAVKQIEAISELESKIRELAIENEKLNCIIAEKNEESSKQESSAIEWIREIETINLQKKELEQVNTELKQNISNLETKAVEQIEAISELESKIRELTIENEKLNCIIAEKKEESLNVESSAIERIREIETINLQKKELEQVNTELKHNISNLETKAVEQMEAISELESKIIGLASEKEELHCIIAEKNEEKSKLESSAIERIREIETINLQKKELEQVNTELKQNISNLETKAVKQIEAISELESKIRELAIENEKLNCIIAEKNEESSKQESSAIEWIREIETINLQKKELEQVNTELKHNISNLETKAVKQIEAISELESKIGELTIENEKLNCIIAEKKEESLNVESSTIERIREIETINLQKKELEQVNTELKHNISNLETKAVEQMEAISELESKIIGLASEKEELHCTIAEKNEEKSELETSAIERIREVETINLQKKELEHVNTELRQNISNLQTEAVEQIEAISELESKIRELTIENEKLNCIIAEKNEESSNVESSAIERIREIETINPQKKEIEYVNSQLRDKSNKLITSKSELRHSNDLVQDDINLSMNETITENTDNRSFLSYSKQFNESTFDTSALMLSTEVEKIQLDQSLHLKSREWDVIKDDVHCLKQDIESLQKTIYLLTTENMEMANKLTTELENAKHAEINFQGTIDELYTRISEVMNEKITLESNLTALNDQLESMRVRVASSNVISNEDDAFASYKVKIDELRAENIELSAMIAERNKEVEDIKESKSLLFDHECIYKEKVAALVENNKCLQSENSELSTDLMDKIEEIDELKEKCEILKKKMELSLKSDETPSDNTTNDLQSENNLLKAEILELKIKLTTLSEENTKFSNSLLQTMLDDSAGNICKEDIQEADYKVLTPADMVDTLQEKVSRLTRLNKKLSELKFAPCNQCIYLKNLNESRRALKLETKSLNQKFEDLQKKFARKCEDVEILKNKINQKVNTSGCELSPNVSYIDDMDVSLVEERVQTLHDELQTLKTDHDKLTGLYEDKCKELEQLRSEVSIDEESTSNFTSKKRSEKNSCRVDHIQSYIDQLKADINDMKKNSTHFFDTLNQVKDEKASLLNEIDGLKISNEEMKKKLFMYENIATGNIQVLESELTNMSKEVEQFFARERMFESQRLTFEMELEELKVDRDNKCALIESLKNDLLVANTNVNKYKEELMLLKKQREELEQRQNNLCEELQEKSIHVEQLYHQSEQEKFTLMEKLRTVEVELHNLTNNLEAIKLDYKIELDSMSMQYEHRIEESENNIRLLNDTLDKCVNENLNLKQELNKLKSIEESSSCKEKAFIDDIERLKEELNNIRLCMIKELKSLKCSSINSMEISKQSVNEIFLILVQTLILKEQEMIKTIRETYKEEKRQLEDKIKQSADSEKRATTWSKELEGEIEKLQMELTEREHSQKEYENKITQLNHLLKECSRENAVLRENSKKFEVDLQNLQTEYEKLYKTDNKREEAIFETQKREKEVKVILENKELEFQSKLKDETEIYNKKINVLARDLDCYKLKNLEMSNIVEELQINEKKLKNIIEANTAQIKKSDQTIKIMEADLQQLTEAYSESSQQLNQKSVHIENISAILKSKCDSLTEYKTKLETILSECEMLNDHVGKQEATIEGYRQEIEELKIEKEVQLETIKKKLKAEEIKHTELNNQLNNRNVSMTKELNELKEKYEELRLENVKLEQKVRCSINNTKAEADIEELKEMNKRLQNNLESANNRVAELQEIRNQTLAQLIDTKAMYDMLLQENTKIKTTLSSYETKYDASSRSTYESKLDELLLEKNTIALELEYKKLQLTQQEKEINELRDKNKELDEELEEYAVIIQERSVEISELENKLYSRFTENTHIVELEEKLNSLNEENRKLRDQVDALKMRLEMDMEDTSSDDDAKTRQDKNMIRILRRENRDLQSKLNSSKRQIEAKPGNSDANISIQNTSIMDRLRRQCDNLSKENFEMKNMLQLYKRKLDQPHSEAGVGKKMEDDENKIACELESRTSELNQKECANKIRDLESKNKDLDIELRKCTLIIHERDSEILKLKENLKIMKEETNKLKSEIRELHNRSRSNKSINNCIGQFDYGLWSNTSTSNENVKKQLQYSVIEEDDKLKELKKKIHDLELQLVSKNGQLAALEIQIQSESFPYERRCKELKEQLLVFRNKNTELNLEIQKLRKAVNDLNSWECDVCRRWRVYRKDQGCQTIPVKTIRFCSTNSGVVEDHVKIEKIEKEKIILKELCRSRNRHIRELEMEIHRLKELIKT